MKIVFTPAVRDQLFSDIRRDNPLAAISLWQKTEKSSLVLRLSRNRANPSWVSGHSLP